MWGEKEPMITFLLVAALSCPVTKVINATKYPWNAEDKQNQKRATKRCGEIYADAPCLTVFKKTDERTYVAMCGAKR